MLAAIGHSERYMDKEGTQCSADDRKLLVEYVTFARKVLESKGWKAMARTHELALYVEQWPDEHRQAWSLDHSENPMMIGATQLHAAQKFVNGRLFDDSPLENLAALGQVEMEKAFTVEEKEQKTKAKSAGTLQRASQCFR